MTRYDKILGGLLGGAVGDAMGAPTETRSMEQIKEKFGGYVKTFIEPPDDVFARGFEAGRVTDDFSLAYCTAEAIIESNGVVTAECAQNALLNWSKTPYIRLAGPTTIAAIEKLKGIETPTRYDFLSVDNAKGTNGSAMKIAPAGLISAGNIDKAINNAVILCLPTHANSTSLSGACAVAAAVAKALDDNATVDSLIEAGLFGAKYGEEYGIKIGKRLACPSVYKRIKLAVDIAEKCNGDIEKTMKELTDIIGSGLSCAEAVPCAFGLIKSAEGNAMESIYGGVNIGNDTDTIATIVGAMAGTLQGISAFPINHLSLINSVNNYDLEHIALEFDRLS